MVHLQPHQKTYPHFRLRNASSMKKKNQHPRLGLNSGRQLRARRCFILKHIRTEAHKGTVAKMRPAFQTSGPVAKMFPTNTSQTDWVLRIVNISYKWLCLINTQKERTCGCVHFHMYLSRCRVTWGVYDNQRQHADEAPRATRWSPLLSVSFH